MTLNHNNTQTALFQFKTTDGKPPSIESFKKKFKVPDHGIDSGYGFAKVEDRNGTTYFALVAAWAVTPEMKSHPECVGVWKNDNDEAFSLAEAQLKRLWSLGEMSRIFNANTTQHREEMCDLIQKHGDNMLNQDIDIDDETDYPCIVITMTAGTEKNMADTPKKVGDMKIRFIFN